MKNILVMIVSAFLLVWTVIRITQLPANNRFQVVLATDKHPIWIDNKTGETKILSWGGKIITLHPRVVTPIFE